MSTTVQSGTSTSAVTFESIPVLGLGVFKKSVDDESAWICVFEQYNPEAPSFMSLEDFSEHIQDKILMLLDQYPTTIPSWP